MRTLRCLLCIGLAITTMLPVSAFDPNEGGHLGITREALQQVSRMIDGQEVRFSERAITYVIEANKVQDHGAAFFDSKRHFDNELFTEATSWLKDRREKIIDAITGPSPNGAFARLELGRAFHTIHDFYAHSNWVNLSLTVRGNRTIEDRLGAQILNKGQGGAPPIANDDVTTCPDDGDVLSGQGLAWLTTGYFRIPDVCYSGPLGKEKCRHGDFSGSPPFFCPGGLSKDHPGRNLFGDARSAAIEASIDFVNQILNDERVAGNARAIKALMDAEAPALVVAISDSASAPVLASGQVWG